MPLRRRSCQGAASLPCHNLLIPAAPRRWAFPYIGRPWPLMDKRKRSLRSSS